jgi:signal transduction histidine kinase
MPLAFAVWSGGDLRAERVNEAFVGLFNLPPNEPEGYPLRRIFRGAASGQVQLAVEQCLRDGEPVRFRIAHGAAAEIKLFEVEVQRVVGDGAACALISLAEARSPLALSSLGEAGVLAELAPLSRGLVYIHDVITGVVRCGPHPVLARLGLKGGSVAAEAAVHLVDPRDHKILAQLLKRQLAAADGEVIQCVCRVRDVDGEVIWAGVRTQVFARTPDGRVQRILGVATDETEHYTYEAEIAAAANALAHAELNERRRIGRELHDSTSQLLVAARLGLGRLAGRDLPDEEAQHVLEDAREAIEGAQREIRNFSYVLHPPSLMETGLEEALRTFAVGFARRTGLDIAIEVGRAGWRMPFTIKVALFRVAQEALMNVYRHAQAGRVEVRLKHKGRRIVLEIEDDGVGMRGAGGEPPLEGVGISGMRARMLQIGGALDLLPGPAGVLVRASVAHELRPRRKPPMPLGGGAAAPRPREDLAGYEGCA